MTNIRKPKLLKRFAALIIDVMLWFLLSVISLALIFDPIVNAASNYSEKQDNYYREMYDLYALVYVQYEETDSSYNYKIIGDVSTISYDNLVFNDDNDYGLVSLTTSNLVITSEQFDQYLTNFYTIIDDLDTFNNSKKENELFDEDGNPLSTSNEDDLKAFYATQYENGLGSEKFKSYKDGKVYNIAEELNNISLIKAYISYLFSFLVFYLAIPLISKKRQTAGKRIMNLMVVNDNDDNIASRGKIAIRFIAIVLIEFFISMLLSSFMYLPLLISIILMVVTIKQSALHDYIARTRVVEFSKSILNQKEEVIDAEFKEIE